MLINVMFGNVAYPVLRNADYTRSNILGKKPVALTFPHAALFDALGWTHRENYIYPIPIFHCFFWRILLVVFSEIVVVICHVPFFGGGDTKAKMRITDYLVRSASG